MKHLRWLSLIVAVLLTATLYVPTVTYAQPYYYRWGPAAPGITCSSGVGTVTVDFSSQPIEYDLPAVSEFSYIYDYNGLAIPDGPYSTGVSGIGSTSFAALTSGAMTATYPAYFAVTLITYVNGAQVYSSTLRGDCTMDGPGTPSISNQVITSSGDVPGPDIVNLPSGAVVGQFVSTTPAYFAPVSGATTTTILEVGKTAWVVGVDASGSFYKAVLSGRFFWVPVETMGPNYDDVWNGTPLPTTVVN